MPVTAPASIPPHGAPRAAPRVHFNGIGGKGIAPAASLALAAGYTVTGDDLRASERTRTLAAAGAAIEIGVNRHPGDADLIVASTALTAAPSTETPRSMARLEFVQHVLDERQQRHVAITGSLGKSTAAALTHRMLADLDPTAYIGADVPGLLCGAHLGDGQWAVVEACEYRGAYRALHPDIVIALNLVQNHEDDLGPGTDGFARSLAALLTATPTPPSRLIIPRQAWTLLEPALAAADPAGLRVETVGADADWGVSVTAADPRGTTFALDHHGLPAGTWSVPAPGAHLVTAAACAAVAALQLGIPAHASAAALAGFQLPQRRMSIVHADGGLVLADDNARQPAQAAALIQALRQAYPEHHLTVAVSPWGRLNRRDLPAWSLGLREADTVWVMPVGDAADGAERPDADTDLATLLRLAGTPAFTLHDFDPAAAPGAPGDRPLLVATVGYDSSETQFTELRAHLLAHRAEHPQ